MDNRIVGILEHKGRILVAMTHAVYDMTDKDKPFRVFDAKAASEMEMGKQYVMVEQTPRRDKDGV